MELRPYQKEAVAAVGHEWEEGNRKTLLVLPTGTGKTIVFANVAAQAVRRGNKVLVLAHRDELLQQAEDKIQTATGLRCAKEKTGDTSIGSWYRIVVGSVQTMMRDKRLNQFAPDAFGTIIIDEAHHCLSNSYQHVLQHFPEANVLGVTATPERNNLQCLGEYFDSLAYEYTLPQAIKEGYLCKIKAQTIPLKLDLSGVSMSAGDYSAGGLGTALDPYLEQIAEEMKTYCKDRKTVVFLPLVATARKFKAILNQKGFHAAEVNGNSRERGTVLNDLAAGKYNVICNAMLLTEGWDCPAVDCVIMLRPTKIRALYCQCIGRGTRLSPGKKDLLILDFLWQTARHELCRPASLICKSKETAEKITKDLEESGETVDLEEAEQKASEEIIKEREEKLAEQLKAMRMKKRKLVDPIQFELSIQSEDLSNYVPTFGWEMAPASKKQLERLEKYGIYADTVENAGKASLLINKLAERQKAGLATPKQIRFLEGRNFRHVGIWSFGQANDMIARIANNNWRTPQGIDPETYRPDPDLFTAIESW